MLFFFFTQQIVFVVVPIHRSYALPIMLDDELFWYWQKMASNSLYAEDWNHTTTRINVLLVDCSCSFAF